MLTASSGVPRHLTQDCARLRTRWRVAAIVALLAFVVGAGPALAQVRATYLYNLSNFGGKLPYDWSRVSVDVDRDETYVVYQNLVRVFNASGMEVFSFGDDLDVGAIADLAVDDRGDIILLSYRDSTPVITRCNFRGVAEGTVEPGNLPEGLVFRPNRLFHRNGAFYFVSTGAGSVIVTDTSGHFREHIDLLPLVEPDPRKRDGVEVFGFNVDHEGNLLFTIAVYFRAYRLTPDKTLTSFGRSGSAPGRFGIAAGIVADSRGNILVTDRLRSVVMVFDKDFRFLTEFGSRGARPENLVVPDDIQIDRRDRIYVTQRMRRGVSVFALAGD